jgi:hypothetical protein
LEPKPDILALPYVRRSEIITAEIQPPKKFRSGEQKKSEPEKKFELQRMEVRMQVYQ